MASYALCIHVPESHKSIGGTLAGELDPFLQMGIISLTSLVLSQKR